jgi:lysophospholipase L1-like esterase
MLECLIIGDSIAVGTAQHRPECAVIARVGITSKSWVNKNITKELSAETVVISLGSNDSANIATLKELFSIRQVVKAKKVVWIVPAIKPDKQEAVEIVADKFEDKIVRITELSKDGVHPTTNGYKILANKTK